VVDYYQNLDEEPSEERKSEKANSEQSEGVPSSRDTSVLGEGLAGKATGLIY